MINRMNFLRLIISVCMLLSGGMTAAHAQSNIPDALEFFDGLDGSLWERVSESGFGNENNFSVSSVISGLLINIPVSRIHHFEAVRLIPSVWK